MVRRRGVVVLLIVFLFQSCSHLGLVSSENTEAVNEVRIIAGVELEVTDFDIPVEFNTRVEKWVRYFSENERGREFFEKSLRRSEYFIPYIKPMLIEKKMPEDLVYLSLIESGFNNHARSRARAVGPWQFMSATGKRYGLEVNWWVDERRNVRKSTLAAIEYLRALHDHFGSWELAAAAYNAGENKVHRAIKRFGTNDFWAISRQRFLRPETRNYVPKLMAAAIVAKNRKQFGFKDSYKDDLEAEELFSEDMHAKQSPVTLSSSDGNQLDLTLASAVEPSAILLGRHSGSELDENEWTRLAVKPFVTRKGLVGGEEVHEFEVKGPVSLISVANAAGISYQRVKSLNPEVLRWVTPPHQKTYTIKLPTEVKDKFLLTYNHPNFPREVKFQKYKVRGGDSLRRIANRFGIRIQPILDLNGFRSTRTRIYKGQSILLPIPEGYRASLSALDLRDPQRRRYRRRYRRTYKRIQYTERKAAQKASGQNSF